VDHKVSVRERATGQVIRAWPVDARELIASGEFEAGDDASERIALGEAAFPLGPRVTTTLGAVSSAINTQPPEVPVGETDSGSGEPPKATKKATKKAKPKGKK
jgi:hypothetical protein